MNYNKLILEVIEAQATDKHKQQVNDAKFRAVEQRVQTYNEFASIVKGCHLRPLDKKESLTALTRAAPVWNTMAAKPGSSAVDLEVSKYFTPKQKDAGAIQRSGASHSNNK